MALWLPLLHHFEGKRGGVVKRLPTRLGLCNWGIDLHDNVRMFTIMLEAFDRTHNFLGFPLSAIGFPRGRTVRLPIGCALAYKCSLILARFPFFNTPARQLIRQQGVTAKLC